jgi:hypothetical protein
VSQLIAAALPQFILRESDRRHFAEAYKVHVGTPFVGPDGDFRTPWWGMGSSGFIGDRGVDVGIIEAIWYEWPDLTGGNDTRYGISGTTRDVYNSPLSNCTVKLFRTVDDSLVYTATSDGNGAYVVLTPYTDNHYLVTYKTGPPDVFGSSANTLTGS